MQRFEMAEGSANKFWEAEQSGETLLIRWGRIGTAGQSKTKTFADAAAAEGALKKLILEKTTKGYVAVGAAAAAVPIVEPAVEPAAKPALTVPVTEPAVSKPKTSKSAVPAAPAKEKQGKTKPQINESSEGESPSKVTEPVSSPRTTSPSTTTLNVDDTVAPWLAIPHVLPLPPKLAAMALPSRRFPKPLSKPKLTTWADIAQSFLDNFHPYKDEGVPEHTARALATWKNLKSEAPEHTIETDGLLLALAITARKYHEDPDCMGSDFVDYLVAKKGVVYLVEVLLSAQSIGLSYKNERFTFAEVRKPLSIPDYYNPLSPSELRVRHHLALANASDWADCAKRITDGTTKLPVCRQPIVAMLAPDLPGLSNQIAFALTANAFRTENIYRAVKQLLKDREEGYKQACEGLLNETSKALAALELWHQFHDLQDYLEGAGYPGASCFCKSLKDKDYLFDERIAEPLSRLPQLLLSYLERPSELVRAAALEALLRELGLDIFDEFPIICAQLRQGLITNLPGTDKSLPSSLHWLQLTTTDPAATKAAATAATEQWANFSCDEVTVATALQEHGAQAEYRLEAGERYEASNLALACIGTPYCIKTLYSQRFHKNVQANFALAVDRWPLAAMTAICELIVTESHAIAADNKKTKKDDYLKQTLNRLAGANQAQAPLLLKWLAPDAQVILQKAIDAAPVAVVSASNEDIAALAPILLTPPWKQARRPRTPIELKPIDCAVIEAEPRVLPKLNYSEYLSHATMNTPKLLLKELGDFEALPLPKRAAALKALTEYNAETFIPLWHEMNDKLDEKGYYQQIKPDVIALLPHAFGVAFWKSTAHRVKSWRKHEIVIAFGTDALDVFIDLLQTTPAEYLEHTLRYGATDLAPIIARIYNTSKKMRPTALQWLLKFPEHAICGLIPAAIGKPSIASDHAGNTLRLLAKHGHEALILQCAARSENKATANAVQAVLNDSVLNQYPVKLNPLPTYWQPSTWRRPVLASGPSAGKGLNDQALEALGDMLNFPTLHGVYAGFEQVKTACTPHSLADFAWDYFNAWLDASAPPKQNAGYIALGTLGNDDTARKLTPLIRAWPGEGSSARAVTGLDMLEAIGTDMALVLLNGIAQKVKFPGLKQGAQNKIQAIADARGLTTLELEDRLTPDFGLAAHGTEVLDFGERAFRVSFDESLKPILHEWNGNADSGHIGGRLKDLPKPNKSDDSEKSKLSIERFKQLKKDVSTIANQQLLRLEMAMCNSRRWGWDVFHPFIATHPLLRHLAQRLVWGVYPLPDVTPNNAHKPFALFRIAEDGSIVGADDLPLSILHELQKQESSYEIGVAHPLEMTAEQIKGFGQLLADYEVSQPFPQIIREIFTQTPLPDNAVVETTRLLGLTNRGWQRGAAQDGGTIWTFHKPIGGRRSIEISFSPGIIVGLVNEFADQTIHSISVRGGPDKDSEILSDIETSELYRDFSQLKS